MVTKFTFLILFLISSSSIISQKIQNGDFSAQDTGWTINGCAPETNPQSIYGGVGNNLACEIDNASRACQTVTGFIIGCTYVLSFDCSRRTTSSILGKSLIANVSGGALNAIVSKPTSSPFVLVQENFSFIATDTTHVISFISIYNNQTFGLIIDNVTLTKPVTTVNQTICFEDSVFLEGNFVNITGTYFDTLTTAVYGYDSIIQTNLTVTPQNLTMINQTICFEDSMLLGGSFVKTAGTYFDTLIAAAYGCDSIIQTNLTVIPQNLTVINSTICFEDSVFLGGNFVNTTGTYYDTLTAAVFGCDSIIQTNLTVTPQNLTVINQTICFEDSIFLQGKFVNISGTYYDTLIATAFGCDSIIQTNLTVIPQNLTVINSTICFEDSMFLGGGFVNTSGIYFDTLIATAFGCDSIIQTNLIVTPQNLTVINQTICFEDSIFLEGKFVNISGTYYDTLTATVGCDSIIQINLTVTPQNLIVINSTICFEDSVFLGGNFVNTAGTYFDTLIAAAFGCDSIIQTNLTVTPQNLTVINQTICFEDSIFLGGSFVKTAGTYFDTLIATSYGCDSIIQTNLTVTPQNLIVINSTICFEDSVFLSGNFVNISGTYFDTLTAYAHGCDSIIQTNLTVTPQNLTVINSTICFEDSVFLGGSFVNTSGTYFDILTASSQGCDSIIQTNLNVTPQNLTVINSTICFEDSIFLEGRFVNTSGIYFDTLIAATFGCDSIIQTNLTVTPQNLTVTNQTICFEDSIFLQGKFVNISGTYYDTLTAIVGCDSIIQTNLTVTPQNLIVINSTICFEDSMLLGGSFVNTAETYYDTLMASAHGCDSIIQTNLTVTPQNLTVINQTICFEDSIFLQGKFVNISGTYYDTLTATVGCDSIIQTNLTVTPQNLTVINQTICFEDSIFLQGKFVNISGTYYDTLTATVGCDSIIQTNLTVTPQNLIVINSTICFEDSVFLGGNFVNTAGTYFDTLIAAVFGCDSIIQTNLTVTPQNLTVINSTICFEDSVLLGGNFVNTTGTYFDTLAAAAFGCDSIIQTNLTVTPQNLTVINSTICFEDSMFLGGSFVNTSGTYFDTLIAAAFGCDSIIQTNLIVNAQKNLTLTNQTICFEDSVFLGGSYVNTTGTYFDTLATTAFGCDSIIQTNLTVIPQNLTVIFDTICKVDSVFLGRKFVNTTGIYFDTLITTAFGCDSIISTYLYVIPPLEINLGNDTTLCGKEVLTITLNHNQATYLWDNGSKLNSNTLKDGVNFVKVMQNGCAYYDTITVTTAPIPAVNLGKDFKHCFSYSSTSIEVKDIFQSYLWNTGETTQSISIDSEGTYTVEVTSNEGCVGEQTITVKNKCPHNIFVPNAFTPDNDGVNDIFMINADNATITNWKVFNRWGEKIFEGNSNSDSWDGTFKGENVQDGTYTYVIYYTAENNPSSVYKKYGHVLLIR